MRIRFATGLLSLGILATLAACSSDPDNTDGETEDAGADVVVNGGKLDSGVDSGKHDTGAPKPDSGTVDSGGGADTGVTVDAGVDAETPDTPDTGTVVDASLPDATVDSDSGTVVVDAGVTVDSGTVVVDAGVTVDSGTVVVDAGATVDSGTVVVDAGVDTDATVPVDAGVTIDAGVEIDASVEIDSGVIVIDAGIDAGPVASCATTTCDAHATCADTGTGPVCSCIPGYTGDGTTCSFVTVGAPGDIAINGGALTTTSSNVTLSLQEPTNLVANPGAEIGNLSSWTIISNAGSGWAAQDAHLFGDKGFVTSYSLDKRSQLIDLTTKGFTQAQLDAAPSIAVREWYQGTSVRADDSYYLKVELRNAANAVIASLNSTATTITTTANWQIAGDTFTGYGAGLKYVYIEDGGKDAEFWAGNFGAAMDGASVVVGGGFKMRFSNDGITWSSWQPFAPSASWTLAIGTGVRTVFVQYQDAQSNVWPPVFNKITAQ